MSSPRQPHLVERPKHKRSRALSAHKRHQIAASWIFGSLLLAFLFYAFVFSPDVLSVTKQRILAFVCALIAGLFGFFLVGRIKLTLHPESNADADRERLNSGIRSVAVEASGGFAAAVLVLVWWLSPWAPVLPAKTEENSITIYRVRVTVLDAGKLPVENSQLRSSLGGEQKKVAGGWELDIPSANKPADGKLTVYASNPDTSQRGFAEFKLGTDPTPAITIHLLSSSPTSETRATNSNGIPNSGADSSRTADFEKGASLSAGGGPKLGSNANSAPMNRGQTDIASRVYGRVIDDPSRAVIVGVRVSIVGFEKEAVLSGAAGEFNLPAHAAEGQMVRLRVEKEGYETKEQLHPAGRVHVTILMREK